MKNLYNEAQSCMADFADATGKQQMEEESQTARDAVQAAFVMYVELLEDLRRANEDQLKLYNDARLENANNIKVLLHELDDVTKGDDE